MGGETRMLVPSPRDVDTYDEKPEMSAARLPHGSSPSVERGGYGFAIVNFANADMVGHSGGSRPSSRRSRRSTRALARSSLPSSGREASVSITADHGNAEQMLEADGASPHTAHTTNPVPVIVTAEDIAFGRAGSSRTWHRHASNC